MKKNILKVTLFTLLVDLVFTVRRGRKLSRVSADLRPAAFRGDPIRNQREPAIASDLCDSKCTEIDFGTLQIDPSCFQALLLRSGGGDTMEMDVGQEGKSLHERSV